MSLIHKLIGFLPPKVLFTEKGEHSKKYKTTRVTRRQYALTPTYTSTNYKSQGPNNRIYHLLTVVNQHTDRCRHSVRPSSIHLLQEFDEQLIIPISPSGGSQNRYVQVDEVVQGVYGKRKWQVHIAHTKAVMELLVPRRIKWKMNIWQLEERVRMTWTDKITKWLP